MTANSNTDSAAHTRLIDDLLWLHARGPSNDGVRKAVDAMIAEYTANPDHYSDESPIGAQYIPDYAPNVIAWEPLPPPHRRAGTDTSSMTTTFDKDIAVDALTDMIKCHGSVKFTELANYLESLGINTAGGEELTG